MPRMPCTSRLSTQTKENKTFVEDKCLCNGENVSFIEAKNMSLKLDEIV